MRSSATPITSSGRIALCADSKHQIEYHLRCLSCGHEWKEPGGWMPGSCPGCGKTIEHGDHLSAHLEVLGAMITTQSTHIIPGKDE